MSDTTLRDLERRWKETGTVADEAAYLIERVRVGDLSRERLELAAYCGHEGAMSAAGLRQVPSNLSDWVRGLGRQWGKVARVRANLALATHTLPSGSSALSFEKPLQAMQAAQSWLDHPCAQHADMARRASYEAALSHLQNDRPVPVLSGFARHAMDAAHAAGADGEDYEVPQVHVLPANEVRLIISTALSAWALQEAPAAGGEPIALAPLT